MKYKYHSILIYLNRMIRFLSSNNSSIRIQAKRRQAKKTKYSFLNVLWCWSNRGCNCFAWKGFLDIGTMNSRVHSLSEYNWSDSHFSKEIIEFFLVFSSFFHSNSLKNKLMFKWKIFFKQNNATTHQLSQFGSTCFHQIECILVRKVGTSEHRLCTGWERRSWK